ncbi:hypothetical protein G7084_03755 [Weissella coleopterorum]|uniref:ABM domain-containing protein n=1 Tax=Weissella coleopterorum TaxID=2714949 RepID=A0A6G8AZS6_9LACO|nr:hypothetical protein [Weissella coleopterorum]QIL50506.1 hypothetical protein G7084_03755 [Weissella coleopterorum]
MEKEYLYTTFGTKEVLQTIQQQHPDRPIYLTFDRDDHERFQLIEYSKNANSPFNSGIKYEILLSQKKIIDLRGMMAWSYLTLNDEEREYFILRTKAWMDGLNSLNGLINICLVQVASGFDYAILMTWKTEKDFQKFQPKRDDFFKSFQYNSGVHLRSKEFQFAKLIN